MTDVILRDTYNKGKIDGAREFAEWLCQKSDIAYVNYVDFVTATEDAKSIDEILAEWQKEMDNGKQ